MRCAVTLRPDAGQVVATCPDFPSCEGRAPTAEEALARLRASVLFWLEACPCDQTAGPGRQAFVGLSNFRFILHDPDFRTALWNTVIFTICSIFLQLPLSLGLALLLNARKDKTKGFFRLALFSPNLVRRYGHETNPSCSSHGSG